MDLPSTTRNIKKLLNSQLLPSIHMFLQLENSWESVRTSEQTIDALDSIINPCPPKGSSNSNAELMREEFPQGNASLGVQETVCLPILRAPSEQQSNKSGSKDWTVRKGPVDFKQKDTLWTEVAGIFPPSPNHRLMKVQKCTKITSSFSLWLQVPRVEQA